MSTGSEIVHVVDFGTARAQWYSRSSMVDPQAEVTGLLRDWNEGKDAALERLIPIVQKELRRMAGRYMAGERRDHTLDPTELVHELYLKLVDQRQVNWKNRAHFFGCAANMMRRLLVDHARIRSAEKRGGGLRALPLDEAREAAGGDPWTQQDQEMLALHEALKALAALDSRKSRVVELHFFGGLSYGEISEVLGVAVRTIKRDWQFSKLWLHQRLFPEGAPGADETTSLGQRLQAEPAT